MSYNVTATLSESQRKIQGIQPIDMYVVNASLSGYDPLYYANINQDVMGFEMHASGNLLGSTGHKQLYTGLPLSRNAIQTNTQGEISELSISIPNTDRVIESIIQSNDYLRGCEVYVITTYAAHLPESDLATPLATTIGSLADCRAAFVEKMYIDSASSDESVVSFSCKPKFIIKNMMIPGRRFGRECQWRDYAGSECDPFNGSVNTASYPKCDRTIEACRVRGLPPGNSNIKNYGGFPGIPDRGFYI